jgi:ribonuclease BN (tRNA processing enzyme)
MKLVFIGTGNCVVDPSRGMPCLALEGGGAAWLIDAGSGSIHAALQSGITLADIRGVLLTHFHVDHTLDLVQLLWLRAIHEDAAPGPLVIAGPAGTGRFLESLALAHGDGIGPARSPVALRELRPGEELRLPEGTVRAFAARHTDESLCYRLSTGGAVLALSGDSGPCDGLVEACREADLAVLECSYAASSPLPTHMGPPECGRIAAASSPRRVILTHLPAGADDDTILREVRRHYRGPCSIASDSLTIDLP